MNCSNPRVRDILRGGYCNIEYTLPCQANTLAEISEDQKAEIPGMRETLNDAKRMIIAPEIIRHLSDETRGKIKVLASPLQAGRLLEADEEVKIADEYHVVSFKGVGATKFALRNNLPLGIGVSRSRNGSDEYEAILNRLGKYRFDSFIDLGLLDVRQALKEVQTTINFSEIGARVQKILAIYETVAISDVEGRSQPISYFQARGHMPTDITPVILVRAMRTNFRILDLINLKLVKKKKELERLFVYLLTKTGENRKEYLFRVLRLFLESEFKLIFEGYNICSTQWTTHARNISAEGEEIDLETVNKIDSFDPEAHYSWAEVARAFIEAVDDKSAQESDIEKIFLEILCRSIKESNLPGSRKTEVERVFRRHWESAKLTTQQAYFRLLTEIIALT